MTVQQGARGDGFAAEWREWQRERWALVSAPLGQAALALTHWLTDEPRAVPGLTGLWRSRDGRIAGSALGDGAYALPDGRPVDGEAEIAAGGELRAGERAIRLLERDGRIALRIFDPAAAGRARLRGIEAYAPDPAWRLEARFDPAAAERRVELFDGYVATRAVSGSVVFELDGVERRLTGIVGADAIAVVFGDATNGDETYGFRFVSVPLPGADGVTTIDFNRAYLPPCSFSDQFVCPLPTPENRLPLPVRAGERLVRRDHVE